LVMTALPRTTTACSYQARG